MIKRSCLIGNIKDEIRWLVELAAVEVRLFSKLMLHLLYIFPYPPLWFAVRFREAVVPAFCHVTRGRFRWHSSVGQRYERDAFRSLRQRWRRPRRTDSRQRHPPELAAAWKNVPWTWRPSRNSCRFGGTGSQENWTWARRHDQLISVRSVPFLPSRWTCCGVWRQFCDSYVIWNLTKRFHVFVFFPLR